MNRLATHPGDVLRDELEARGLSANKLALALRVPANAITRILGVRARSRPRQRGGLPPISAMTPSSG